MIIIPAIDLQNCEAVRLYKGDYAQKTIYSKNPEKLAQNFEKMGAKYLHIVDLDGAKSGQTENIETIKKIKQLTNLSIQVGGGIRNIETVKLYLEEISISRVILGTAALENPEFLAEALKKYGPEKIVVGVDIKNGFVSTSGWLETSDIPYLDFLKQLENLGIKYTVITDISKDGTLNGPNFELYEEIKKASNLNFVVSGGIKDHSDINNCLHNNYYATIVGKAYYEGKIDLTEVLKNAD